MFHKLITASEAGEGVDVTVSCFKCGGLWIATPEDSHQGFSRGILAANGDDAVDCTGNTNQYHHYEGECSCDLEGDDNCLRDTDCNCLSCDN
jgi:hypothetical protein